MDIEELAAVYKKEKSWMSSRLSTIDALLDRAAYGNSSEDEDELNAEYESLEKQLQELKQVGELIGKVNELNRTISLIEVNIDALYCYPGNESKIENLTIEMEQLEEKRDSLLEKIAKDLNVSKETQENTKIR